MGAAAALQCGALLDVPDTTHIFSKARRYTTVPSASRVMFETARHGERKWWGTKGEGKRRGLQFCLADPSQGKFNGGKEAI